MIKPGEFAKFEKCFICDDKLEGVFWFCKKHYTNKKGYKNRALYDFYMSFLKKVPSHLPKEQEEQYVRLYYKKYKNEKSKKF